MNDLCMLLRNLKIDRRGVTALEYGMVAALIAAGLVGALNSLKANLSSGFNYIGTQIASASK